MKKFLFTIVALLLSASTFSQQPQRREFKPEEMATRMADGMKKELNLNDEQYKSVYNLYLKRGEEMKARREKGEQNQQVDREARREEMKKSQEALNAELQKILTTEQYSQYEEMLKKQQQQRRGQGNPRGPLDSQRTIPHTR
jgi:predicted metal-dependent peptidase